MSCPSCSEGFVFREFDIPGGKRFKRVRCECNPEPESKKSSRTSPRFSMRSINRRFETDYREDLSRFPGDPQARVSSPKELQRLIDQRKREGWIVGEKKLDEIGTDSRDQTKSGDQIVAEAYEAAKATNFTNEA